MPFRYALGNWQECPGPQACRQAFSSPGLTGAYPWLDRDRGYAAIFLTFSREPGIDGAIPLVQRLQGKIATYLQAEAL